MYYCDYTTHTTLHMYPSLDFLNFYFYMMIVDKIKSSVSQSNAFEVIFI